MFSSRVHSFRLSGPGRAWREPLLEGGLRGTVLHTASSPVGPCRVGLALALFTGVSCCLWGSTRIPGAISVTNCTVVASLARGLTGLLALRPVALASSIPRKCLSLRWAGPATGVRDSCRRLSWCRVSLASTCEAGSRGTGGRGSSRGIAEATQGHGRHGATAGSGGVAVLWVGHLSK